MRLWVALVLTVALTPASHALGQEAGCLTVKKISTSPFVLQQGGNIEFEVQLAATNCSIPVDVTDTKKATHIVVNTPEGFGTYPPVVDVGGFGGEPVIGEIKRGHEVTVRVVLHASRAVPVGEHFVPAALKYVAEDSSGNIATYSQALDLPVLVVEPLSQTSPRDQHGRVREGFTKAGLVLLGIVLLPVATVLWLLGGLNDC